jgi:maltose O-acetyltransferase
MKYFWLILYYGFAKHLPKSTTPVIGGIAKHLRRACAKHLFEECGALINVE